MCTCVCVGGDVLRIPGSIPLQCCRIPLPSSCCISQHHFPDTLNASLALLRKISTVQYYQFTQTYCLHNSLLDQHTMHNWFTELLFLAALASNFQSFSVTLYHFKEIFTFLCLLQSPAWKHERFLRLITNVHMLWLLCHGRLARWLMWRACDVGEAKEGLENELWRSWSNGRVGEWAVT